MKGGEQMRKEKWLYQHRPLEQGEYPWAILIDIDYLTSKRADTIELSFSIYSEKIDNPTHSVTFEGGHKKPTEYVRLVTGYLAEYSTVTEYDVDQITNAVLDAMLH